MGFLKWTWLVWASIVLIAIFSVISIFSNKKGVWSTMSETLVPREKWFSFPKSQEDVKKFESRGEAISRQCIEQIFSAPFKNTRLDVLKNPNTGRNLELDCFNADLKIAVEYHGIAHYQFNPFFHKTNQDFIDSMQRDLFKKQLCDQMGITLIIVPYNTKHEQICTFLIRELTRLDKMIFVTGWNDTKK